MCGLYNRVPMSRLSEDVVKGRACGLGCGIECGCGEGLGGESFHEAM